MWNDTTIRVFLAESLVGALAEIWPVVRSRKEKGRLLYVTGRWMVRKGWKKWHKMQRCALIKVSWLLTPLELPPATYSTPNVHIRSQNNPIQSYRCTKSETSLEKNLIKFKAGKRLKVKTYRCRGFDLCLQEQWWHQTARVDAARILRIASGRLRLCWARRSESSSITSRHRLEEQR